jgi:hypothetical protein
MNISVETDIIRIMNDFQDLRSKSVPYAISQAINDTLFNMRTPLSEEEKSVFDKPVPFTTSVGAWEINRSSANALVGDISLRPDRESYLHLQVFGGTRVPKKKALAIPQEGGVAIASHGGLKRNWKVLLKDKGKYFSGIPKGHPNARPGVYRRLGASKSNKAGYKLQLHVAWENAATYKKRFYFFDLAERYVQENFSKNFERRLQASRLYQQSH